MGKLRELINIFINPIPPEKSLEELLLEDSDLDDASKEALLREPKINWSLSDDEEPKKGKNKKTTSIKESQIQHETKSVVKDIGTEIADERG